MNCWERFLPLIPQLDRKEDDNRYTGWVNAVPYPLKLKLEAPGED